MQVYMNRGYGVGVSINKKDETEDDIKSMIMEFLEKIEIPYSVIEIDSKEKICIDLSFGCKTYENKLYYAPLSVSMSNKGVCKVYPYEIMYIAIEDRESVLHLIDERTIKTNFNISYWESVLPTNCFVRPHNSYIVNLNYVTEVTHDFVYLKYKETNDSVYTSQRKVSKFKKAFLNFRK